LHHNDFAHSRTGSFQLFKLLLVAGKEPLIKIDVTVDDEYIARLHAKILAEIDVNDVPGRGKPAVRNTETVITSNTRNDAGRPEHRTKVQKHAFRTHDDAVDPAVRGHRRAERPRPRGRWNNNRFKRHQAVAYFYGISAAVHDAGKGKPRLNHND